MNQKFSVEGMTCANCALGIEKTVKKLNGVASVSVSLMAKEMSVEYDQGLVSDSAIISLVKSIGYTATIYGEKTNVKSHAKKLRNRFLISLIFLIPLVYFCMGSLVGAPLPERKINLIIQWALATVIIGLNFAFYTGGVKAVLRRMPNMDTLIALGSSVAYVYSVVMTLLYFINGTSLGHVFFEGSAMVLVLVTLGKWLEELSKKKTSDEIEKLSKLMPETVTVIRDDKEVVIPSKSVKIGDIVLLKTGDYVSVDGEIIEGNASVDKSALTGESLPVEVGVGDKLSSGSVVRGGYVLLSAKKVGSDTLFSKIIDMVKTAGTSKSPVQKIVDKVAAVFVPIVTSIAILTFALWWGITGNLAVAINFAVSVLVISCPCSLGLATPVAVMATMGKGASFGVLYKDASALEMIEKIDTVFLDKTATITEGKPEVVDFITINYDENLAKEIIFAMEDKANHPLADCVKEFAKFSSLKLDEFNYVVGKGIKAKINGKEYLLGNKDLVSESVGHVRTIAISPDRTILYLAEEDSLIAVIGIADKIRSDTKSAIADLKEKGINVVMLTGDAEKVAKSVADEVSIDNYKSGVLPEDKKNAVDEAKLQGKIVAMVGDGINDSPALKSADVGVAVGNGTDIAIDTADVVLTGGGVSSLSDAIDLSKKAKGIIKGNLFWAFFYNLLAIPVAGGALSFVGVIFEPWIASVCMSLSSIFVVTNALRIRRFKTKKQKDEESQKKENIVRVFLIEGMMCNHCTSKVKTALESIDGVISVAVSLETNTAKVVSNKDIESDAKTKIQNAGFKVIEVK